MLQYPPLYLELKNTLLEYSNDDDNELEDDLKKLASLAADIH